MAEFNQDTAAETETFWATYGKALKGGESAADAASQAGMAVVRARRAKTAPQPAPKQVKHLDRALGIIPLLVLAVVAVLLMAGCKDDRRPSGSRSTASASTSQSTGQTIEDTVSKAVADVVGEPAQTQNPTPASSSSGTSDGWDVILQVVVPTPAPSGAQCPGATNAEIEAAKDSNAKWVCYAATREAAK